jgi:hypothetical protein
MKDGVWSEGWACMYAMEWNGMAWLGLRKDCSWLVLGAWLRFIWYGGVGVGVVWYGNRNLAHHHALKVDMGDTER